MNKLTFEEWQKEYGYKSLVNNEEYDNCFTDTDEYEKTIDEIDNRQYKLYCARIDRFESNKHDNKTYDEVISEIRADIHNTIDKLAKNDKEATKNQIFSVMKKLEQVEEKNRCIRVRMYDWLSDLFADWSKRCHERSVQIDSPCSIKLPNQKAKPKLYVTGGIRIDENGKACRHKI